MFSSIKLNLPSSQYQLRRVYKATYRQEFYQHDYARVTLRDWKVNPKFAKPGTPIQTTISGKTFFGYIHDIKGHHDSGKSITELGIIGASYVMRQSSQKVYKNVTADQVIVDIAKRYKFAYKVVPHPRVYPQLSQAGATDWEFMVKLAKQCGYALRAEGAAIYFQPFSTEFNERVHEAKIFTKMDQGVKKDNTIYYFKPLIGETLATHGANKAATSVAGVNPVTGKYFKYTKQNRTTTTRKSSHPELFDAHATHTVANTYKTAASESKAIDEKSVFPYTAEIEILGGSSLHPGAPMYLDNLGPEYSGYWTVINIEHRIKEQNLNAHLHTSIITVGTDSLGAVNIPGVPKKPSSRPIRHIIPNVRNTKVKVKTGIKKLSLNVKQAKYSSIVSRKNRADVSDRDLSKSSWTSQDGNIGIRPVQKQQSPIVKEKILKHAARG